MRSTSLSLVQARYREFFLFGLLAATFLPACLAVMNFGILDQPAYPFVFVFSLFTIMGSAHTWLTVAYYFDRQWVAHFNTDRLVFYVAPAGILAGTILLALLSDEAGWNLVGYGLIVFLNVWHHSRQNWGIMAMVGKLRGVNAQEMRVPLVYAWPFFLIPLCLYFPAIDGLIDKESLVLAARISSIAYCGFAVSCVARSRFWREGDLVTKMFAVALCLWFLPVAFLYGKPYSLFIWVAAHALQYYLFVLVSLALSGRDAVSPATLLKIGGRIVVILSGLTIIAYVFIVAADTGKGADWNDIRVRLLAGVFGGINLAHFWLDAFIWRFANLKVRTLHGSAFAF